MGIIGILLAALIVGFLLVSNLSPSGDSVIDSEVDGAASEQLDTSTPKNTIDSVEDRANNLLQSSEDKYRELDQ